MTAAPTKIREIILPMGKSRRDGTILADKSDPIRGYCKRKSARNLFRLVEGDTTARKGTARKGASKQSERKCSEVSDNLGPEL